jgi:hypothetical protein
MLVQQDRTTGLDGADQAVVDEALLLVRDAHIDSILADLAPRLTTGQRASVAAHCVLSHTAVLVFPASLDEAIADLRAQGPAVSGAVPDVVVLERLARRYRMPVDALDVAAVHVFVAALDGSMRRAVLHVLEVPPGSPLAAIAHAERADRAESRIVLDIAMPEAVIVAGLRAFLSGEGGLVADGGAYDPVEDRTVLCFRNPGPAQHRLEIRARGHWDAVLAEHLPVAEDPAKRLLELMTGAWTTQGISVAVELGVADELPAPGSATVAPPVDELAARLALDPDALARLLRFLASVGVVTPSGDSYMLTEMGAPLRHDAHHSMRPLAMMYGGPFYQSFAALDHAVRTSEDAFEALFGIGHFDYFAERPELAALFDASMAASAPMLEAVTGLADLSDAHVVVDVGGGNGELLGRILGHLPHVRGVLFERESVLGRARARLSEIGVAERCQFVGGDFTETVPAGGDVYLLSRVLHDWDDERCLTILRRCADAVAVDGRLLLVERLLSDDGQPSLAEAWDLHMLCNVGGRERTAEHYGRLLAAAGFVLEAVSDLPLDGHLLHARKIAPAGRAE